MIRHLATYLTSSIAKNFLGTGFGYRVMVHLHYQQRRARRRFLEKQLREKGLYGDVVQAGPFTGLKYPPTWASCRFEKIIGAYEAELHDELETLLQQAHWTSILNIGSAEGYFTVGMALRVPDVPVFAFDTMARNQAFVKEMAELNGVSDRFTVKGECSPDSLLDLQDKVGSNPLVVCDVDSYEKILLDPQKVAWLKRAAFVVELHDFMESGIHETLVERFEPTHEIQQITSCGPQYGKYPALRELSFVDIHFMVGEERAAMQDWLVMTPRS